jgi:hypothetical protein
MVTPATLRNYYGSRVVVPTLPTVSDYASLGKSPAVIILVGDITLCYLKLANRYVF